MLINIKYFASLKDCTSKESEKIETNSVDANSLFNELNKKYSFTIPKEIIKVAINESYCEFETPLKENDTVVFIPPVTGG